MSFLSPTLLAWLPAALLPLLIWWLYRRRRSEVRWSANVVLRRVIQETGQRNIWRQFLVLALRCVAIAAVVLAFARPLLPQAAPGVLRHCDGVLHQVLLIDNSDSMRAGHGEVTRYEEMLSRVEPLLRRLRHGDHCQVVPLVPTATGEVAAIDLPCPITDDTLTALSAQLTLQPARAALGDGLQLAAERFHTTGSSGRELIVLTDLSAADQPPHQDLAAWHDVFTDLDVRTLVYEVRDRGRPNVAVEAVRSGSDTVFVGWQYHLYVELRNYSRDNASVSLAIKLAIGEQTLHTDVIPIDLKAGEQRQVDVPIVVPDTPGPLTVVAGVNDGSFEADNSRRLSLNVKRAATVVLVHPEQAPAGKPLWQDSFYVEAAGAALTRPLGPGTSKPRAAVGMFLRDPKTGKMTQVRAGDAIATATGSDRGSRPPLALAMTSVAAPMLTAETVADADAVVLADVNELSPELVPVLTRFVERGGGVFIALGAHVYTDLFNERLGDLAPVRLVGRRRQQVRTRTDWDYDDVHLRIERTFHSPLLRRYLDDREGPIENVRVYNHFLVEPGGTVLMRLSNGDPLLIEARRGRGGVMLYTSSLGGDWNTLPVRNMYPNLVYAWLTRICGYRDLPRNLAPGQPLITPTPTGGAPALLRPGADTPEPLVAKIVDGVSYVRADGIQRTGELAVLAGQDVVERIAVQDVIAESDAVGLAPAERQAFTAGLGCVVSRDWQSVAAALAGGGSDGVPLAAAAAVLMLLLLSLDAILTRHWWS
jgi:hypothetical protein